jgi:hypothetical protein
MAASPLLTKKTSSAVSLFVLRLRVGRTELKVRFFCSGLVAVNLAPGCSNSSKLFISFVGKSPALTIF